MKVLKPGTGQKGWSSKAICNGAGCGGGGCGAELLVEQPDLFITGYVGGDYTERGKPVAGFLCCKCGVETELQTVPTAILRLLLSKSSWTEFKHRTKEGM